MIGARHDDSVLFTLDALQAAAQASNVPIAPQFLRMLPYVLTIIALVGAMGKAEPPAYVAKPYEKA